MPNAEPAAHEVLIVGGGLAGLSAAIYLGRAMRDVLVLDAGRSMAVWEPDVQNYLGFPEGLSGEELIDRGRRQAMRFGARFVQAEVLGAERAGTDFVLASPAGTYRARRLLLATGSYHIPPDIPGVRACLGRSLFFCKDCDGYRVRGARIVVIGCGDQAAEYALAMRLYSPHVAILTNGQPGLWSERHAAWLAEYQVPVEPGRILEVRHRNGQLEALCLEDGSCRVATMVFATRGDVYFHRLARTLGAELDDEGQIAVDADMRTSVPGLYAAGCVTPANCQMIIAAGQGAAAAQAISRELFFESLDAHALGLADRGTGPARAREERAE